MPLIVTHRHRPEDLRHWAACERVDTINARRLAKRLAWKAEQARAVMRAFVEGGGYLGISWGKDSVVCAHLLHQLEAGGIDYPSVWVRVEGWENPDCTLVRDAFLSRWPLRGYDEIKTKAGANRGGGTSAPGFALAARLHGDRHISGVRAAESTVRAIAMSRWGTATDRTCRPIGRWTTEEVFVYLHTHGLPVHPAYGYTMGGLHDRLRIRTGSLGGSRGNGMGRAEWETAYYRPELDAARSREST